jgi:hypothetical protein
MRLVITLIVLIAGAFIVLRELGVLDSMTPRTRFSLQVVLSFEVCCVIAVMAHQLLSDVRSYGVMGLLVARALHLMFDGRVYPPRQWRLRGRGRRKLDFEQKGEVPWPR